MRVFFSFFLTLFLFLFSPLHLYADENFDVSASTTYQIFEDNNARVTKNITITNKKEFTYSPNYNISFGLEDIRNIQVYNSIGSIPFDYEKESGIVNLTINFTNPPKGLGMTNNFTLKFDTKELVDNKGDIYEVSIPGTSDSNNFVEYDTQILVPSSYPEISILKPNISEKKDTLNFSKEDTKGAGIVLVFGENQYYDLSLNYNISNPNLFPITTEVAFPPNTNYQKVLIESLSIQPSSVRIDSDGNFLASYSLLPREKKTIKAKVKVKLLSAPEKIGITEDQKVSYTKSDKYWEKDNSSIRELAQELKTPEKIFEYVIEKLNYNFDRISSGDERLGALQALNRPDDAVCLEYADLFVALVRAANIPARTVEGYAYTKNSHLRPTSLAGDVLHAWAEYYDFEKESWIMVDPTWGSTTHGIDYFNSLDLDHIAFAIKGEESTYPIPAGGYKFENDSKDIEVSFISESDFSENEKLEIINSFSKFSLAGLPISGFVTVKNTGNTFIDSKIITVTNISTGEAKEYEVKNIPPFGEESFVASFDTLFLTNSTHDIKIHTEGAEDNISVKVSFIPDLKLILIGGGIFVSTAIIATFAVKTGRVYLQRRKK